MRRIGKIVEEINSVSDIYSGNGVISFPELCLILEENVLDTEVHDFERVIRYPEQWLFTSTYVESIPGKGIYVTENPNFANGKTILDEEFIEKVTSKVDGTFEFNPYGEKRVSPFGFKTGVQSYEEFGNNPGIIAIAGGEKNAKVLEELSDPGYYFPCFSIDDKTGKGFAALKFGKDFERFEIATPGLKTKKLFGRLHIATYFSENGYAIANK